MTIHCKYLDCLIQALTVAALVVLPGVMPVNAKDTDVYLMSPTVARDDSPNVMIIFDNSGSMGTTISTTRPAYDPAIDYCTGDLDTLTGVIGANAGKPSKNKCLNSASALAS